MGGCASMNTNQTKSDVQVRKVKLTVIRAKQREETKRAAIAKQQVYFGEDLSTDIVLEQYAKQGYLLAAGGLRTVSSFLVVTSQEQKAAKIFQPMLKNMVLDHQESFPKWLTEDEQFRNDQMQEFLQKCQETAKLQSADISAFPHSEDEDDHESDGQEGGDENDGDDDESPQNQKNKITQFNKKSKVSSSSSSKNKDNKGEEESDGDDDDDDQDISQISEGGNKLLKSQNNNQAAKQSKNTSKISNKDKEFVRTKSIIEDKSLISKKNAVEESESDNKPSDDDEDGRQHVDMQKFQDIQGLKNSQKNNNSRIHSNSRNNSVVGKQGGKGSQQHTSDVVPSLRAIKNEGQDMESSGGRNKAHSHAQSIHSQNLTARGARASNGTNIYVIKEFKIIKNNWINQAICLAEIQTSTSILEFKRRYFYEFDKLSAFLSYLLALKRMNFPNLLTFSYVQIGEASYSGDLAELKKRTEALKSQQNQQYNLKIIEPTDQKPKDTSNNTPVGKRTLKRTGTLLLANSQLMASQKQASKVNFNDENNEDDEDDEEESRLIMFVDRIFPDCGKNLEEVINSTSPGEDILRICTKGFKIFDAIANTLCKMHRAGFSYRVLRPSMIRIFHSGAKEFTAYLDSPDFIWRETELNYIQKNVATEADFMLYDCKCLSALMIHYFLAILDIKQRRRDSHRESVNPSMIFSQSNVNSPIRPNQNLETLNPGTLKNVTSQNLIPNGNNSVGSLQCISNIPSFSEIVSIYDQEELQNLIKKLKIPLVAVETLDQLAIADLHSQKSIEEFAVKIQGVLEKGPQIAFKHDSLSAYLSYHGSHPLKNENNHVYFRRKNQVHFYEFESKTFKVIKLIRKKAKFQVRTHLTFCHYDNCFYFFAAPNSSKVVKIPLNTNSTQRHVINQKSEVVFFKSVKNIPIEEPQILSVIPDDFSFSLYIFNSRKNTDENTNDVYYNSFIISIQYKQDNPLVDDWKEKIQIFEGPRNYTWRRKAFHFYDPHNKFIYCILDSNNIFEKGIRFSYFDTSIEKGDFKDGNLRFACSTQEVYEQFCDLSMNIESVEFCVEVQHGVFLLQASKNIYVLDFNYKCFYSFSTLKQLHNYKKNNHKHPHRYQYAYEILNQPFEIKFNNALNLGKNVVFQEGMLHILGRKEIETVICSYELLPTQGVMVLKKCVSLHSFDDILLKIPVQIVDIWNFQEFKKIVFEQEEKSAQTAMQGVVASHQNIAQQASFNNLPAISGDTPNPNTVVLPPTATRNFANNINSNNNNLTVPLTNNALFVKQSQQTIALSSQNNLTALPDKSRGSYPENGIHVPENQMHHNNQANSKQQEAKLQQFISKISSMSAGMDGTNICEANMYHENQYKILKVQQETNEYRMVRIMHQSGAFSVRRVDINNIELYEQYISLLELNPPSNYLMQVRQCFMNQDDETGGLTANIVEEDSEACLLDELRKRCIDKTFYKSQELGQILKALFKAIIGLQTIELAHGCIHPRLIYFTRKGFIRLAGWYLENREGFQNDFIDACSLIYQIATLEFDENQPLHLTSTILQSNQEKLKAYPGLFSFLLNNLLILQDGENLQIDHISEDIREIYQSLQVNYLKVNKESLSSSNKHIFWVGYGSNYVISCQYEELTFVKNEVFFHNNISYKFSKYNMFTFDQERTMYMSGALKEDFKTPSQLFYSMDFSFIHQAKLKLRQLKDIPNSILQPSLFFCNDYVYCIGGYYIKFDGSKNISKKAYRYSIKSEDWEQISDMPVSVVSATVIAGKDNQILYLFGGVSEEVDLRGKELNYLTYDIEMDEWSLKIDLSIRSPFVNNRYVKPTIDHIGNNIFISVQRTHEAIFVQFFELVKGGINIKFRIDEEKEDIIKEQFAEIDIFNEIKYQDYFRTYQDDLSLIFVHDTVYLLDEFSNALLTINFANFNNIKYERVPCGLIAIEKNNVIDKQLSLDRKSSVDSFYFNGY